MNCSMDMGFHISSVSLRRYMPSVGESCSGKIFLMGWWRVEMSIKSQGVWGIIPHHHHLKCAQFKNWIFKSYASSSRIINENRRLWEDSYFKSNVLCELPHELLKYVVSYLQWVLRQEIEFSVSGLDFIYLVMMAKVCWQYHNQLSQFASDWEVS